MTVSVSAAELRLASKETLKEWLQDAIVGYHNGEGGSGFAPFADFIGLDDLLAADIAAIYATVPATYQGNWRTAVSDIIAELPTEERYAYAFDTLLDVARLLPVYAVFSRCAERLRSGRFAALKAPNGQTLFERTLLMAIDMTTTTSGVADLLSDLLRSPNFDPSYSALTFTAICRADPDRWPEHLSLARPLIGRMLLEKSPSERGLRRHAKNFIAAIGLKRLAAHMGMFKRAPFFATEAVRANCDDWLFNALFSGPAPLLESPGGAGTFGGAGGTDVGRETMIAFPYGIDTESIARVAHEANRAYCVSVGDYSQPSWDDAPDWQKKSLIDGVAYHAKTPDAKPMDSHENWLAEKARDGWTYGPLKCPETKQHPCFVPYQELPQFQRSKDYIFGAVVKTLLKL